jgi:hypothetical protein
VDANFKGTPGFSIGRERSASGLAIGSFRFGSEDSPQFAPDGGK